MDGGFAAWQAGTPALPAFAASLGNARMKILQSGYTTEMKDKIVVLLAFEKKSKSGISTPRHQIDLVHKRLKEARSRFGDK